MPQLLPSVGRWSVLVAAAAVVAACSDSSTTPSRGLAPSVSNADASPWPEFNGPSSNAHIMHTKPWFAANGNGLPQIVRRKRGQGLLDRGPAGCPSGH